MDQYASLDNDGGSRNRGLLGGSNGASTYSSSSSSSSSITSFSPLSPSLHERLFPPTLLARVLWSIAVLLLLILVLLTGYEIGKRLTPTPSTNPDSPSTHTPGRVVLISLDGFRASYLDTFASQLPTLRSMRWNGAWAERMISCYPSLTFPNHWSIVTGLYTPEHGIISNGMYDPVFNASFNMQTVDSRWWQGEPVWNTAMKQDKKASILFWPGSEVEVQGMRPNYWAPFSLSYSLNDSARIDRLLGWLQDGSCDLCVSYFDLVDHEGHSYGPDSPQVATSLAAVDSLIARLLQGIYTLGLYDKVTVLLTSDHGMSAVNVSARGIFLSDYTDVTKFRLQDSAANLGIWPYNVSDTQRIYDDLYGKVPHLTVFDAAKAEAMHYTGNRRIPPIVGVADDGWVVRTTRSQSYTLRGTHGFDPRLESMGALFLGHGKGLKQGMAVKEMENVNVYSLICWLLGIEPAKTSGSLAVWKDMLSERL